MLSRFLEYVLKLSRNAELLIVSGVIAVLSLALPLYVIQALTRYLSNGVDETLYSLTVGVLIALLVEFILRQYRRKAIIDSVNQEQDIHESIEALSKVNFESEKLQSITNLPEAMRAVRSKLVAKNIDRETYLYDLPFIPVFLIIMYLLSPVSVLLLIIIFTVSFVFSSSQIKLSNKSQKLNMPVAALNDRFETQLIKNYSTLFLFSNYQTQLQKFANTLVLEREGRLSVQSSLNLDRVMRSWAMNVLTVLIVFTSSILVFDGEMQVGSLIALNILAARAYPPLANLPGTLMFDAKAFSSVAAELGTAGSLEESSQTKLISEDFSGLVEISQLGFQYRSEKVAVFNSLSFTFSPGSVTVITGKNATGKTTLFKLLTGVIQPQVGTILVDGVNMSQLNNDWWRQQVIAVPQEPNFFDGTIMENLEAVSDKAKPEEFATAISTAGLKDFLDKTLHGTDSKLDFPNSKFSLGTRKRIALARAIISDGKFVVMDEPTEGLDSDGAKVFYEYLNLCIDRKKTVVVLSHDPAIIKGASMMINLDNRPFPKVIKVT